MITPASAPPEATEAGSIERPQAVIRIVPHGGASTAKQILDQWTYLGRGGAVLLQRSERHLGVGLPIERFRATAESWVMETGYCPEPYYRPENRGTGRVIEPGTTTLTTHIVVSFPIGTRVMTAFAAGRGWADEMFGSGRNGGTFDYVTACHDDRPHPHVHLVVNRRALEGHWLKISRRHPQLNYDTLRAVLVDISGRHGIALEATSRLARGIEDAPITYAEYRRRARAAAAGDDSIAIRHPASPRRQ